MAVLIDTTGIWGLYFSNSKYSKFINFCLKFTILVNSLQRYQKLVNSLYHEFMKNLHSTTELIVPKITFVELIYPVYTAEGINEMQKPGKFLDVSKTAENITILEETLDDVTSALNFCVLHEDIFITEKGNMSLFDAILASIWKRTGLVFYTRDHSLGKFGDRYNLKYKIIEV